MLSIITRRTFLAGGAAALMTLVAGCSGGQDEPQADAPGSAATGSSQVDETGGAAQAASDASTLVVYFSATGNTAGIAQAVAGQLGADTFAIEASVPYTDDDLNYNDDASRTSQERADARPELVQVTPGGWNGYDTVLVGYPIWWGEAAWPLRTFAEGNSFDGKTVVPFCTSASSGIGRSGELLAGLAGGGEWREGERFSAGASEEAASWAAGLGL